MKILVEGEAKNQKMAGPSIEGASTQRVWTGRTSCNRVVNFMSDGPRSLLGRFVDVKIIGSTGLSLQGELIPHEMEPLQ